MLDPKTNEYYKPYAIMWEELKNNGAVSTEVNTADVRKVKHGLSKNKHRDIYFARLHPGARIRIETKELDNSQVKLTFTLLHVNITAEMFE